MMKSRTLKSILLVLIIFLLICGLIIVIPRIWSGLNPDKPPVGYHFVAPAYLALGIGLEEMVERAPEIPADIEELKDIEYKNIDGKSLQLNSTHWMFLVFITGSLYGLILWIS